MGHQRIVIIAGAFEGGEIIDKVGAAKAVLRRDAKAAPRNVNKAAIRPLDESVLLAGGQRGAEMLVQQPAQFQLHAFAARAIDADRAQRVEAGAMLAIQAEGRFQPRGGIFHADLFQRGGGKPAAIDQQVGRHFARLAGFQRVGAGIGGIGREAAVILPGNAGRPREAPAISCARRRGKGQHAGLAAMDIEMVIAPAQQQVQRAMAQVGIAEQSGIVDGAGQVAFPCQADGTRRIRAEGGIENVIGLCAHADVAAVQRDDAAVEALAVAGAGMAQ